MVGFALKVKSRIIVFIGPRFPESRMFDGAAGLYERLAADVAGPNQERAILDTFFRR